MLSVEEYINLETSQYYQKPKFEAYQRTFLTPVIQLGNMYDSFTEKFNLDYAVGDQLDIIGSYLNLPRNLPVVSDVLPAILPDDLYRTVLKARVLQYQWDGTIQGIYDIITRVIDRLILWLIDYQNTTYTMIIMTAEMTPEIAELFLLGYITPKPAGYRVLYQIYENPFFYWNRDEEYFKGWDQGYWT